MLSTSLFVSTFPPFSTLSISVPSTTPLDALPGIVGERINLDTHRHNLILSLPQRPLPLTSEPISSLHDDDTATITLRLAPLLLGGKGGFGSQLRAAGGRMSSQKTSNNDSCRDLNGRRLSTVKEAKQLAQYLEDEPLRKKAAREATKAKLEALEKQLGIDSSSSGGPGPSTEKGKGKEPEAVAGKKHRFDDTEYLEQSEAIVDNVKSAAAAALLKKRKKAKLNATPAKAPAVVVADKPTESSSTPTLVDTANVVSTAA